MSKTYSATAITLRTTKLGETDLILSLLNVDGSLLKAVLKSARNPRSKTVGYSTLYQTNNLLLHKGKSLDIVTEVQTKSVRRLLVSDYDKSIAAAFAAEISYLMVSSGNQEDQLYLMLNSYFDAIEEANPDSVVALGLAFAFKALALAGVRPQTEYCELCDEVQEQMRWSAFHGGAVCKKCLLAAGVAESFSNSTIPWIEFLLKNPFALLRQTQYETQLLKDLAEISQALLEDLFSRKLKTFPAFSSGIIAST